MIIKKSFLFILIFFGILGYSIAQQNYNLTIEADIENLDDTTQIQLKKLHQQKTEVIDKETALPDQKFVMNTRIETAGFYQLSESEGNYMIIIAEPGETISIQVDMDNFSRPEIKGSPGSELFYEFLPEIVRLQEKKDSLEDVYTKLRHSDDTVTQEQKENLINAYNETKKDGQKVIKQMIMKNKESLVGLMFVDQLDAKENIELLEGYAKNLNEKYPDNKFVQNFYKQMTNETRIKIGEPAPEIELPTPDGENMQLSDLKGKVVLIDFWASWCSPCRKENPEMVRLYNKYKDDGFTILGVSLDEKRKAWLNAIEKDSLTWHHVSDLKGWKSKASNKYNVSSIPHTVLVDEEGRIIARNLRGEPLKEKLEEIFGH